MFKIVVLASTNGTDLQAIIDEMKAGLMPGIELGAVISNKKDCYAIQRAREQGYKTHIIANDDELFATLKKLQPDLVVLVGYMRILAHQITKNFKIINVHPALIPKYCGRDFYGKSVHEAVLANHETETGMTIHWVDEDVDTGDIILQKTCPVSPTDTPDTLKQKVQTLEKKWYPEVIRRIAAEK